MCHEKFKNKEFIELQARDFVELTNLMLHAQEFLNRAQFILRRSSHEQAADIKVLNQLLWENQKKIEVEAVRRFLPPKQLVKIKEKHKWKQSGNLNEVLKY